MPHKTIRGTRFFWEEEGTGLPVVLLHPFPLNQSVWAKQRKALGQHYRIITPDFRGFGKSEGNGNFSSMDTLAEDVYALLNELELDHVILGGLSMGGFVTLAFYRRHPTRVRGLILANTRPQADDTAGRFRREAMAKMAEREGSGAVGTEMLPKLFGEATFRLNPHIPIASWRKIDSTSPKALAAAARGMASRPDSTSLLPKITCPVLVIVGEEDSLTPPGIAKKMADDIPDSTLVVIPGAGHLSNLEQPKQFNQALKEFLDIVEGTREINLLADDSFDGGEDFFS